MDAKDTAGADRQWRQLRSCKFNVLIVLFLWRAAGSGSTQGLENYISWCHRRVTGVVADNWVKRKCPWLVVGDFPPINDNVAEQDFCAHGRQIMNCRICGGRHICLHGRRRCQCSICKVQSSGPQSVTAAKNDTAQWLRDLASSNAENFGRCHEGNSFSSCKSVGKCYRAPSASIGSDGSVWRRYERLWSFRGWFTMFTQKIGTAGEHWNISERGTATFDHNGWRKTSEAFRRNGNEWQRPV